MLDGPLLPTLNLFFSQTCPPFLSFHAHSDMKAMFEGKMIGAVVAKLDNYRGRFRGYVAMLAVHFVLASLSSHT